MFSIQSTFSGFSVHDMAKAKQFYGETLGLEFEDDFGGTKIKLPNGNRVWMYESPHHQPADYTMLNFVVDDIDEAYQALAAKGVSFQKYPGAPQDENGIMRGKQQQRGPNIAWFKDPSGNILSILEN